MGMQQYGQGHSHRPRAGNRTTKAAFHERKYAYAYACMKNARRIMRTARSAFTLRIRQTLLRIQQQQLLIFNTYTAACNIHAARLLLFLLPSFRLLFRRECNLRFLNPACMRNLHANIVYYLFFVEMESCFNGTLLFVMHLLK